MKDTLLSRKLRKSVLEAGQRLIALYEIESNVAALCALLSLDCVLTISTWIYSEEDGSAITDRCNELREEACALATVVNGR